MTIGKSLEELKTENAQLQEQYDTLKVYIADMPRYKQEIENYNKEINNIIDGYEVTTTSASLLHYYENLLKKNKIKSPSLSYQEPEVIDTVSFTYRDKPYSYNLQNTQISVSYSGNYSKMLETLDAFDGDLNNEHLKNISMSLDGDGSVNGSMSVVKDTIYGENRNIEDLDIDIQVGSDRVFSGAKGGGYKAPDRKKPEEESGDREEVDDKSYSVDEDKD